MADARVPGALLVLLLLLASGSAGASPQQIASSAPIPCSATPFGQRLTLGLEHEYAVVRGDGGSSSGLIGIHDGPSLTIGASRLAQASGFATLPSLVSTPVDLDGDGTDELAIAGIKNGDAPKAVTTTSRTSPTSCRRSRREPSPLKTRLLAIAPPPARTW